MAEIRELKEKRQEEDNVLLSIAAGCIQPRVPNLVFKYADTSIHEDSYKLIKYSCDEIWTSKEQSNKSMRLWCTFLESILSVPSRCLSSEGHEIPSASRHHGVKSAGTSIRGREENLVGEAVAFSIKQPKPSSNADGNSPLKQLNSGRLSSGIFAKEDGSGLPKDPKLVASAERSANSGTALPVEEGFQAGMKIISGVLGISS